MPWGQDALAESPTTAASGWGKDPVAPPTADAYDAYQEHMQQTRQNIRQSIGHVIDAFGYGAMEGFGKEPIASPATVFPPELDKQLRSYGVFNDYSKGSGDFARAWFEGIAKGVASGAVLANRVVEAGAGAIGGAVSQTLKETGVPDVEGMLTDPSLAVAFGPFGPSMGGFAEVSNARRLSNLKVDLSSARASGTIAEGAAGFHDVVPPTPEAMAAREAAARAAGVPVVPPQKPPKDIHELARRIDPETMGAYDAKVSEITQLRTALDDLGESAGPKSRADAERRIVVAKTELAEMMPDVTDTYRQARGMMPETPKVPEVGEVPPATPPPETPPASSAGAASTIPPPRATGDLKTVEGTGELRTRGLAEHIEAKAIENDLATNFGDLPEYNQVSMADQASKAADYIAKDYENAKAVAMGRKAPPKGVLPESILVAVEKVATAEGDVETLRQLATESKLMTAATTMGQRIRTLGERGEASPVAAIQEVQKARMADLAKRGMTGDANTDSAINALTAKADNPIKATVREIKTARGSAPSTPKDWASFIDSIRCT